MKSTYTTPYEDEHGIDLEEYNGAIIDFNKAI